MDDIQYFILSVTLLGADYAVYFCASAIQYILNKEGSNMASNRVFLCNAEDIMMPLRGFKPKEIVPNMKQLESIYGKHVAPDVQKGIDRFWNMID